MAKVRLNKEGCVVAGTVDDLIKDGVNLNKIPSNSGLMHTDAPCPPPNYKAAPNEKVIQNGGSFIVLGTDRPNTKASGKGAGGSSRASSIDLVVGRMASARKGEGPKEGEHVDNSFTADAARIYITGLGDLDDKFGLASGVRGQNTKNRSGIALKADGVRIIGRESVKIVTYGAQGVKGYGSTGETNSLGGTLSVAPTIEFIAGNSSDPVKAILADGNEDPEVETLQPVIMGDNLNMALTELTEVVLSLTDDVREFQKRQVRINRYIATGMTSLVKGGTSGKASASTNIGFITANNTVLQTRTSLPLWGTSNKGNLFKVNFLHPGGAYYICSESVFTT
jgi:hypothetical protein